MLPPSRPCYNSKQYLTFSDSVSFFISSQTLYVDCANGVGGSKLSKFAHRLEACGFNMKLYNTGAGVLNGDCGSDFVQKEKKLPTEFGEVPVDSCCCSIDGDADRLLFFSPRADGTVKLYDGDKIAVLMAIFCKDLIKELPGSLKDSTVRLFLRINTSYLHIYLNFYSWFQPISISFP